MIFKICYYAHFLKQYLDFVPTTRSSYYIYIYIYIYTIYIFTTYGVTKCKNKRCEVCNIIIKRKSYTFENPKTKFIMNKNVSCNSKKHSLHDLM